MKKTAASATVRGSSSYSRGRRAVKSQAPSAVPARLVRPSPVDFSQLPEGQRMWRLVMRMSATCTSKQRVAVRREAFALVTWALSSLDWRLVDEAIGWAETTNRKPVRPRAIAPMLAKRAQEIGVALDTFVPPTAAPAGSQAPLADDE